MEENELRNFATFTSLAQLLHSKLAFCFAHSLTDMAPRSLLVSRWLKSARNTKLALRQRDVDWGETIGDER